MRRPFCRPPPLDAPTPLSCGRILLPGAQGTHDTSAHHRANVERLRDTSEDTPHTPQPPLAESVPHNESARAILAAPKDRYLRVCWYFYICLPPPLNPVPFAPDLSRSLPVSRYYLHHAHQAFSVVRQCFAIVDLQGSEDEDCMSSSSSIFASWAFLSADRQNSLPRKSAMLTTI
jgi:hypothetical protein